MIFCSSGCTGVSDERDASTLFGAAHRDHGRTAGSDERPNDGALRRVFGKELLLAVRPLREEMLSRVQGRSYGHTETRDHSYQLPGDHSSDVKLLKKKKLFIRAISSSHEIRYVDPLTI